MSSRPYHLRKIRLLPDGQQELNTPVSFWKLVDTRAGANGCWPWTKSLRTDGYGQYRFEGRTWPAHQLAALFALGSKPILDGRAAHVLHSCDNRLCCNPAHLRYGTPAENTADLYARKRMGRRQFCRGEAHHNRRFTEDQVRAIRARDAAGESYAAIARDFGASETNIGDICKRKRWAHVA